MIVKLTNTTLFRVQPLLLTVFGISASQNLFFLFLPLKLQATGHDIGSIGTAMSFYAFGAIIAGLLGAKLIRYTGHIRTFSLMSAVMVTVSVLHSFYDNILLTGFLRALAGFALITNFITLESWLNVTTDKSNRGQIFSIYQICVSIGAISAPFVLSSFALSDPRILALVGVFLSISIMIMSITRLPVPTISDKTNPLHIKELWNASPSGTLTCFCSGLITSVCASLITIYAHEREFQGWTLSLILSSLVLGGLVTQYPTGWFADRFDKRTVTSFLMAIGTTANSFIIFDAYVHLPTSALILAFFVSGGSAAALFPLAVTQIFDNIDPKDAVRATGTIQITAGVGGFLGPIIAGQVMNVFGTTSLFYYIGVVHIVIMVFVMARRIFVKIEKPEVAVPYQVTTEPTILCRTGLDPRIEYRLTDVGDPTIKLLLQALAQEPSDPSILIKSALENSHLRPMDIAVHLVLAIPKHADQYIGLLVSLYPDDRMAITQSLYDIIVLRKHRINALVEEGLCVGATEEERHQVHQLIREAIEKVDSEEAA